MAFPERFGDYLLLQRLSGGMSEVFLAVRLGDRDGRTYVLKRPALGERASGASAQSLLREAAALEEVRSEGLGRLEQKGEIGGLPFIVLEHRPGMTLRDLKQLDAAAARVVARDVARALSVLHEAGWVHCDVAPSNVLVDDVGDVVLLDLGIAERKGTKRDAIMGNAGYVAPDVVALKDVAPSDDVYALGILWAEMAKGERLFAERDVAEAAVRPDAKAIVAALDLGDGGAEIVGRMLARDASARPTASEVAAHLDARVKEDVADARGRLAARVGAEMVRPAEIAVAPPSEGRTPVLPTIASGVTTRSPPPALTVVDRDPPRASSAPPAAPSRVLPVVGMVGGALALAVLAFLGGRAVERRQHKPQPPTLLLPQLPPKTEYRLDGHTLVITDPDRPIPLTPGKHVISLAGPKRESKEYEFYVNDGDSIVVIGPFSRSEKTDAKKP